MMIRCPQNRSLISVYPKGRSPDFRKISQGVARLSPWHLSLAKPSSSTGRKIGRSSAMRVPSCRPHIRSWATYSRPVGGIDWCQRCREGGHQASAGV